MIAACGDAPAAVREAAPLTAERASAVRPLAAVADDEIGLLAPGTDRR